MLSASGLKTVQPSNNSAAQGCLNARLSGAHCNSEITPLCSGLLEQHGWHYREWLLKTAS